MQSASRSAPHAVHGREARKLDLSPARQALVGLLQDVQFGEIRGLRVVSGEPVLRPFPEVLRDLFPGRPDAPHPARGKADFALKSEVVALFELFDQEQELTIDRIVVQAGLPVRIRIKVSGAS